VPTHRRIRIETADGSFEAYEARPDGAGPFPALVVLQEIFGVNAVMRETCDRFAAEGYLAVCPDLFWRIEPGVDITDRTEAEWAKAFDLFGKFDVDRGIDDVRATVAHLRRSPDASGKVGAVGYCLGGKLAYLTAARTDADAAVGYYPVGLAELLGEADRIQRPLMLHVAEEDGFVPKDQQAKVAAALSPKPNVILHSYPGLDHAFARKGGNHWDAEGAALADRRTAEFLAGALR
jgi:carboxymethylenebutenolidase